MKFRIKSFIERFGFGVATAAFLVMLSGAPCAWSDPIPGGWQASNMKPIGYSGEVIQEVNINAE